MISLFLAAFSRKYEPPKFKFHQDNPKPNLNQNGMIPPMPNQMPNFKPNFNQPNNGLNAQPFNPAPNQFTQPQQNTPINPFDKPINPPSKGLPDLNNKDPMIGGLPPPPPMEKPKKKGFLSFGKWAKANSTTINLQS